MQPEAYHQFTEQLIVNLEQDENILGLVAAGSMAQQDYQPDEWSDHDFFVVTHPGVQNRYRQVYDWLPRSDEIAWAFQETEHGVKVIYRNGHLLEFAVFDEEELKMARINRYRVLFDRGQISVQMAENAQKTSATAASETDAFHAGQFLTNILVGMGRYWRGEKLSAHKFIKINAIHHLFFLLNRHTQSPQHQLCDNFDPTRRFEFVHPHLGPELEKIMLLYIPETAQRLVSLFERELPSVIAKIPAEVIPIVEKQIHFSGKIEE
jgi:lincosamide nucleotidyltransferase B/F